jgi:ubiquinone/menaquinone biosynthesis C-methylase UbiE
MELSSIEWHQRFLEQAGWTRQLRQHLYARAKLRHAGRILDLGCGTGALLDELLTKNGAVVFGLDRNRSFLSLAAKNHARAPLIEADAHFLPIVDEEFDVVLCHFLLLWVSEPALVLAEAARILKPGGAFLALAEPDYGGRIDNPEVLQQLGRWQQQSLRLQGANPQMGRQLAGFIHRTGFKQVEFGVLGGEWQTPNPEPPLTTEWEILTSDLGELSIPEARLTELKTIDALAWEQGERVLYVPTFYAWGKKA